MNNTIATCPDFGALVDGCARQAAARQLANKLSRRTIRWSRGVHLAVMSVTVIALAVSVVVCFLPPDDGYTMATKGSMSRTQVVDINYSMLHQR